jgi:hypothetical protein
MASHSIELTPEQLRDVTDLLRIESERLYGIPGCKLVGKLYDDLYDTIQRQWTIEQARKRRDSIASNIG